MTNVFQISELRPKLKQWKRFSTMQCQLLFLLLLVHISLQSQDLVVVPSTDSGTEADAEVRVEEAGVSTDQVEDENCVPQKCEIARTFSVGSICFQ